MNLSDIPEEFLKEEFIRFSSGPGGQHVNRTESGVRLHFRFAACPLLNEDYKKRLCRLAGAEPDAEEIVVSSSESRSQMRNRDHAKAKLDDLLKRASFVPRIRRATKPTRASKERRLASKSKRGQLKKMRSAKVDY